MSVGPDIASMIAQHAQSLQQAPSGNTPGAPAGGNGGQPVEFIRQMIQAGMQYMQVEQDPERKATMAKVVATLHGYEADEQKNQDAALGTSPAMKAMRNQVRG